MRLVADIKPLPHGERTRIEIKRPSRSRKLNDTDWRDIGRAIVNQFGSPESVPWGASMTLFLQPDAQPYFTDMRVVSLGRAA